MSTRPILSRVRYAAWGAVALLGALVLAAGIRWYSVDRSGVLVLDLTAGAAPAIGGPFAMTDHRGQPVTERDFVGRPMLAFFGFTHCPDIYPTTLADMGRGLEALSPDASRLVPPFVTVDPERDTPEQLANYLGSFDPASSISPERHRRSRPWHVRGMPTIARLRPEGYSMDHTASVYLRDAQGRFAGTINTRIEDEETALAKLRSLLQRQA